MIIFMNLTFAKKSIWVQTDLLKILSFEKNKCPLAMIYTFFYCYSPKDFIFAKQSK
jgi:hypothetical protein